LFAFLALNFGVAVALDEGRRAAAEDDGHAAVDLDGQRLEAVQQPGALDGLQQVLFDDDVDQAAVLGVALADRQHQVAFDLLDLVALDAQVLVLPDRFALVAALLAVLLPADDEVAVADDALHAVVLDAHVEVAL